VKWGGKLTTLTLSLATKLEALAIYVRPAKMQELLQKGDSYRKFPAMSDKRPELYQTAAKRARMEATKTTSDMLAECQHLEYDPDPDHKSQKHVHRIRSAVENIGSTLAALQQTVKQTATVGTSIQLTVEQTSGDVTKNLGCTEHVLTVATETRDLIVARDDPQKIKQRDDNTSKLALGFCLCIALGGPSGWTG